MRHIDLSRPASAPSLRLARLTGHLRARLLDFGPGGPEVVSFDPDRGVISARFPGQPVQNVLEGLSLRGITAARDRDLAQFRLDQSVRFEDLDYLWGCLFDILA